MSDSCPRQESISDYICSKKKKNFTADFFFFVIIILGHGFNVWMLYLKDPSQHILVEVCMLQRFSYFTSIHFLQNDQPGKDGPTGTNVYPGLDGKKIRFCWRFTSCLAYNSKSVIIFYLNSASLPALVTLFLFTIYYIVIFREFHDQWDTQGQM